MILISLVLFMIYYLLNMPWPFYPESLDFIQVNGTYTDVTKVNGGCYDYYKWCAWTKRTPIYVYIFCATVLFGVAFPYFATPSGTIYSHVLGPRNQFVQLLIAFLLASIFYRRLVPLRLVPKTGESAKYKRGTFWRL
ncbi:unnamed protein product [Anisakis simplex]|uniref:BCCT, betaine/carnitine/choline family transporter n=1 Tax=Anisakis simplex TaxID=6269 RepID=A0A0M3KI74_ANISI|nr:unnamed protein product [Anisakis simplex]